jgi:uncharacterized protein (TIGR02118 family)
MIRVTAIYTNVPGARFDHAYYRSVHLPLADRLMRPFGLLWIEGDRPISSADGGTPSLIAQTHAYFPTLEDARRAISGTIKEIALDVRNYTDVRPTLELHEVFRVGSATAGERV